MLNVAIDGPSGAGKSTVARAVARLRGILYLDTGALYRAIGLYALECGADTRSEDEIKQLLPHTDIALSFSDDTQRVLLNGEDVTARIRTQEVAMAASDVSALRSVRQFLLSLQRDIAGSNNCVMDGRDIGTVILPNADVKVFLTASPEERARRRVSELVEKGESADYDTVLAQIKQRDKNDSTRELAPLRPADDAVIIDTTDMDFDTVVARVSALIGELV